MILAQLIVASILGWLQREQSEAIMYLREENRILKAQPRDQQLQLTDADLVGRDDRAFVVRFVVSSCGWPQTIQPGATRAFKAR